MIQREAIESRVNHAALIGFLDLLQFLLRKIRACMDSITTHLTGDPKHILHPADQSSFTRTLASSQ